MKKLLLLVTLFSMISGCASIIESTQEGPIKEDHTSRTTGSFIEDEVIEIKALVNIDKASEDLKHSHISVTSFNGIVLLTGQVASPEAKTLVQRVVQDVRKVREIHNALEIAGPTSAIIRTNDTWITTKVKAQFIGEEKIDSTKIKVVTENGVVYLMSLISRQEADIAVNLTRGVAGVQKVVKIFEYID